MCSVDGRVPLPQAAQWNGDGFHIFNSRQMSTEIRNWEVVAKALEDAGNTSREMYIRAKALAQAKLDPIPTNHPEAP